jgi:hypothetical protein
VAVVDLVRAQMLGVSVASDGTLEKRTKYLRPQVVLQLAHIKLRLAHPMPSDNYSITVGGDTSLIAVKRR